MLEGAETPGRFRAVFVGFPIPVLGYKVVAFVDEPKTKMHNFSVFQSSTHCKMQIGIDKDESHPQSVF